MKDFVHLHVHTDYSMLDGACQIKRLAKHVQTLGMKAIAITDHGNMYGAFEFYQAMKEVGVKPIIGCEFYVAPSSRFHKDPNELNHKGYHLILLAKDLEGYRNLCRLNYVAFSEGFYYNPRIDWECLEKYHQGIVCTTACIGSEVNQYILDGNEQAAKTCVDRLVQCFGKENLFLELQDHNLEKEARCNEGLLRLAKEFNLRVIATNDVHYIQKEHAKTHEILLCIGTNSYLSDPNRFRFPNDTFYLRSSEEMSEIFKDVPEAITNTLLIAEMCQMEFDTKTNHYPVFTPPPGYTCQEYITHLCMKGLRERYHIDLSQGEDHLSLQEKEIVNRMKYELQVIEQMGYTSYFLIVWDFIHYARSQGIPVGPGRGSGAGSLVAYLLGITDIDPLRFHLLFERFLNPERCSPPDFDVDFCERHRDKVVQYVWQKYGIDHVAQICTYGTLKAKQALKDVLRVMGHPFEDANRISKLIPNDPKITLQEVKELKEIQEIQEKEPWIREAINYASQMEGLTRQSGIHACGVIIGDQPLTNLIPLARGSDNEQITQFSAGACEQLGLLKMDFLGLRTLTIIQDTCDFILKSKGVFIDPRKIPLNDPITYELLRRGDTMCVFQLESGGMQNLCRRTQVEKIEEVIALIALYRPGPMQFINDFLDRKFGRVPIEYDVPVMEEILKETYGIMVYQEQVMQVVQKVAGFTLGGADILRRAMGKKKADVMAAQHDKFIEGCKKHSGLSEEKAEEIWNKIETFAGYGFNKSHSAAYAILAVQTAYLKAHYPVEFMCANLCCEIGNNDRIAELTEACHEMGIRILPPDVNVSDHLFTVDGEQIRFGLAGIKGSGEVAASTIIEERKRKGPYKTLEDFVERIGPHINRRILENLIMAGALDSFGYKRSQMFAIIDQLLSYAREKSKERATGQGSLFDLLLDDPNAQVNLKIRVPDIEEWPKEDLLEREKELLGFYVTGHPLEQWEETLRLFTLHSILKVQKMEAGNPVRIGGMITKISKKTSLKDQRPWVIFRLEDKQRGIDVLCFADDYQKYANEIQEKRIVIIEGTTSLRDGEETCSIRLHELVPIEQAAARYTKEIIVPVSPEWLENLEEVQYFKRLLANSPGESTIIFSVQVDEYTYAFVELPANYRVRLTPEIEQYLQRVISNRPIRYKIDHEINLSNHRSTVVPCMPVQVG